jgi:twinkle protein
MDWQEVGIEIKTDWHGNVKAYCPKCKDTRKNKGDKSLSVNIDEKVWNCHHCGWAGRLIEKKQKEHVRPKQAELKLSQNAQEYLKSRGFTPYTIQRFNLCESSEFMPQKAKEMNCLNFGYYRNGELINIKYRSGSKDFKMVAGAELILFNLDSLEKAEECVITEGEFDCMAAAESGYYEVVSVPNGASKGNQKLEYLDNCYESFELIKKIIIATDNDEAGISLKMELARRLGRHRCWYIIYPDNCKDLNEILIKHGKSTVKECITNAQPFPVEGVFRVQDIESELDYYYDNGFQGGDTIGSTEFDKIFSFRRGELTTITGIPGSGKSAKLDDWLIRLSSRMGWKHGVCSPENQPVSIHISKLASCFIGKPFYRANRSSRMSKMEWDFAKYFINDYFFFFNVGEVEMTVDGIIEKAAELVTRYGIDSLVMDPWNTLEHNLPIGMSETQFVSKSLTRITNFAKSYGIHIFLVAHPTKLQKDKATGKFEIPNLYNISGSAHFFNKTDNGITVYRDYETNLITVYVQKVRFFFVGKIGFVSYNYDLDTGRYAEDGLSFEREVIHFMRRMGISDEIISEPVSKITTIINFYETQKNEDELF